ncbi:heme-dependent oxidative N-demethylase family protein [Raineyella fluvialis]|uniref:DUF3445 domain-containing protein n=1 Tax=Raineyella fluvialis TaxID=2662261 RepID=A0A5Q2FAN9_9ACTN|nr:DUF3445 domain-containing protein [Raineyella fluvialis]QGF24050.1 DUF3445 domain-containing protein [Raineyella fluvialis]
MTTLTQPSPLRPTLGPSISGFPFPFTDDTYRYSTNVQPARQPVATPAGLWGTTVLDLDTDYERDLAERTQILAADPTRHAVLPHMRPAAWDTMLTLMRELAQAYPADFTLHREGKRWHWHNARLGISAEFVYGDASTLPDEPLRFISRQVQEDIVLLDQRGGSLHADAGVVTFAADWSFGFDVGMTFLEIHGPVPRIRQEGVITRAHEFLQRLQPHRPYRRTNWTMTIGRRLDVSTERYPEWGPDRELIRLVDDEEFGRLVHLRVEVQHLVRLPDSGAILFLIRTYMLPLEELATVEPWRTRTAAVLAELPADMADYKGIGKYKDRAAEWLTAYPSTPPATPAPGAEEVHPPALSLPVWPERPDPVDADGSSFLVIAVGDDPRTDLIARDWARDAARVGGTALTRLGSMTDSADRARLAGQLDQLRTGMRLMVVGGQYDVLQVLAEARAAGAIAAELRAFVVHRRDLPVQCAHCRQTHRVEAAPGDEVACPGCQRILAIHPHLAAVRGSFLGSDAHARDLP